jgi:hypothetical protein
MKKTTFSHKIKRKWTNEVRHGAKFKGKEREGIINVNVLIYIYKGKAIPLQAWTGPGGSRRLRLPDFKTIGT